MQHSDIGRGSAGPELLDTGGDVRVDGGGVAGLHQRQRGAHAHGALAQHQRPIGAGRCLRLPRRGLGQDRHLGGGTGRYDHHAARLPLLTAATRLCHGPGRIAFQCFRSCPSKDSGTFHHTFDSHSIQSSRSLAFIIKFND